MFKKANKMRNKKKKKIEKTLEGKREATRHPREVVMPVRSAASSGGVGGSRSSTGLERETRWLLAATMEIRQRREKGFDHKFFRLKRDIIIYSLYVFGFWEKRKEKKGAFLLHSSIITESVSLWSTQSVDFVWFPRKKSQFSIKGFIFNVEY